jgi:hypothetical protein
MFDYRELMNLLSSRGAASDCASCGADDWVHGDHLLGVHTVDDDRQIQHHKGTALAAFCCRNCGFVKFFAPDAIDATPDT